MARPWFRQKAYGLGITPCSWEGLAVTAAYVAGVLAAARLIPDRLPHLEGLLATAAAIGLLTAALFAIGARTMEGEVRWRWGRR